MIADTTTHISSYDYPLPEERIAKFPLPCREDSKLLVYRHGVISQARFRDIGSELPGGAMLVFNNTRVVRARIMFHKQGGARIEVFCLEPHDPADYERAFAATGRCSWSCMVGNLKKWKEGVLSIPFEIDGVYYRLDASRGGSNGGEQTVVFEWDAPLSFGQLLEALGRIPIPPYLNRESEEIDTRRYQTVYSRFEGSVAAPTAGLHFSDRLIGALRDDGFRFGEVTLHVGAGTFLPVKCEQAADHHMHTEHFTITASSLREIIASWGRIIAVGTTSVRTLESVVALGYRVAQTGNADRERPVGQWECYDIPSEADAAVLLGILAEYIDAEEEGTLKASTRIMIMPGYRFMVVNGIITNFHQPRSTLLLLVSALIGDDWRRVYGYALENGFRFLSYGDSSLLLP